MSNEHSHRLGFSCDIISRSHRFFRGAFQNILVWVGLCLWWVDRMALDTSSHPIRPFAMVATRCVGSILACHHGWHHHRRSFGLCDVVRARLFLASPLGNYGHLEQRHVFSRWIAWGNPCDVVAGSTKPQPRMAIDRWSRLVLSCGHHAGTCVQLYQPRAHRPPNQQPIQSSLSLVSRHMETPCTALRSCV